MNENISSICILTHKEKNILMFLIEPFRNHSLDVSTRWALKWLVSEFLNRRSVTLSALPCFLVWCRSLDNPFWPSSALLLRLRGVVYIKAFANDWDFGMCAALNRIVCQKFEFGRSRVRIPVLSKNFILGILLIITRKSSCNRIIWFIPVKR